jgi:hypothetical protein
MNRYMPVTLMLVLLVVGSPVERGWAIDPVLLEAQRTLSKLGYSLGVADGIYGPQTKQALAAFQRDKHLPVTGTLDTATLQALHRAAAPSGQEAVRPVVTEESPLQVVLHYLLLYAMQPARILPYVTGQFRQGLTPQEWIDHTRQALKIEALSYLSWHVQRVEVTDAQATVEVQTRVEVQYQEQDRQEVFSLVRSPEGKWLIDAWRIDTAAAVPPTPRTGS